MRSPEIVALTCRGAQIPKAFADRSQALRWAEVNGDRFPGCRLAVKGSDDRLRTIWKHREAA